MIPTQLQTATRIGLNVLLLLAGVIGLRLGQSVVVPLLIALLLAAVLWPAVEWLHQKLKIRWALACLTVIFGLVLVNILVTGAFSLSVTRLVQQLPSPNDEKAMLDFYASFYEKLNNASPWQLDEVLFPPHPKDRSEIQAYQNLSEWANPALRELASLTFSWLWQWLLILFILLFLLIEGKMLGKRVIEIFGPSQELRDRAGSVLSDMAKQVRTYIVWRTIINFALALIMGMIYSIAQLKHGWTWAILLAMTNYVPYVGQLVAGVPPVIDAFFSASPLVALVVLVLYVVILAIEGWLIVPLVMGRSMNLNATTVMLACLFWDLVWGMTGLFLAMPIMAGVKAILYHVPEWRVWANLMSTETSDESSASHPPPPLLPPVDGKANGASAHAEPSHQNTPS